MRRVLLATFGLFLSACWFGSCTRHDSPDYGPPACPDVDGSAPTGAPLSRVYVVDVLTLPEPSFDYTRVDGFDIDGNSDSVCGNDDYVAATSTSCSPPSTGVDNALGPFLSALVGTVLQENTDSATFVTLVRVDGIDDFVNDPSVDVTTYRGRLPDGAPVAHTGPCSTENALDPNCRLAAGQRFDVDATSFRDGLTGGLPVVRFAHGAIVGGRLEASGADVPFTASLSGYPSPFTIVDARFVANIDESALRYGVLGGSVDDAAVLAQLDATPTLCAYAATLADALALSSDLSPTAMGPCPSDYRCPTGSTCDRSSGMCIGCTRASIAFDFDAITAVQGDVVAPPMVDAGPGCDAGVGDAAPD